MQIEWIICQIVQSDQGLHCPVTESVDTAGGIGVLKIRLHFYAVYLMLCMLGKIFLYFPQNRVCHFMQIVS